jgi:hypothetical protein
MFFTSKKITHPAFDVVVKENNTKGYLLINQWPE